MGNENVIYTVSDLLTLLKKYQFQFRQSYRSSGFIFRGMRNKEWSLLPGLFREYSEPQKSSIVVDGSYSGRVYSKNENEILSHFKKEAGGFLPNIPQSDDFVWLQYAQHFGVPTRLLDFTANPLIALYFCCKSESEEDGVVWIINTSSFQNWSYNERFCLESNPACTREEMIKSIMSGIKGYIDYDKNRLEKTLPVLFVPAYIDQRMSAQSSRFLLWGRKEEPLEDMITDENKMTLLPDGMRLDTANDQRFLTNIIVAASSKHSILQELDLLDVNEKTVFPGLDGIGHYLERYYRQNADDICNFP